MDAAVIFVLPANVTDPTPASNCQFVGLLKVNVLPTPAAKSPATWSAITISPKAVNPDEGPKVDLSLDIF